MDFFRYTDQQRDDLIQSIYDGETDINNLPKGLYKATADKLKEALYKGFGNQLSDFEFGTPNYKFLKELRDNVYIFSGAKTATQIKELQSLMYEGKRVLEWPEYKQKATSRFQVYNGKEGYLESEWITAHTAASSAQTWHYAEDNREIFPMLRSVVIIDANTTPECLRMSGVTSPVDAAICNKNKSPRHWRCRCYEEMIDKYSKDKPTAESKQLKIMEENSKGMSPVFQNNPGKT